MDEDKIFDEGYGLIGNISTKMLLDQLTSEKASEYRNELKKQDKTRYEQYIEWERRV